MRYPPTQTEHLHAAREKARANAANRRANTIFTLSYRGGGAAELVGYTALASYLHINQSSIPVLLSKGGGSSFNLVRPNPLTEEEDIVTITRSLPAKLKTMRRPRGRPPSFMTLLGRAERELAQAAQAETVRQLREQRDRHKTCTPAKTVPKRRNRRTDDATS